RGDAAGEASAPMSREPEVAMSDLQTGADAEAQGQETESLQCSGVTFRKLRCTRSGWFPWGGLRYCGTHIPTGVPYQMIEIARSPEMGAETRSRNDNRPK